MSSRGKPKPKLRDLSREHASAEESTAIVMAAQEEGQPIAAAILGAAIVEQELEALLRRRLGCKDDDEWGRLVGEMGPLGTFYRKIAMGRTLRMYEEDVKDNLDIIRSIRNVFAHAKKIIRFDHELIVSELKKVKIPRTRKRHHQIIRELKYGPQTSYVSLCVNISIMLLKRQNAAMNAASRHRGRKLKMRTISSLFSQIPGYPGLNQLGSLAGQLVGPSEQSLTPLLDAFHQTPPTTENNKDKK
jgi:hypothetical protein